MKPGRLVCNAHDVDDCTVCFAKQQAIKVRAEAGDPDAKRARKVLLFRRVDDGVGLAPLPVLPPVAPPPAPIPEPAPVEPAAPVAPAPKAAPRWAGVDPGARHVEVIIGEGEAAPLRFVARAHFEVGRLVELAKPRKGKRGTITHRRIIDDSDMEKLLGDLAAFVLEHEVDHVAVERASHFAGADGEGVGARAALMLRSQHVGGEIAGSLRCAPFLSSVRTMSSRSWRASLRKAFKVKGWREAVVLAFGGTLPAEIGEHGVDAGGVVAARALPERKPAAPRARGEAAPKRPSSSSNASRSDARRAKRRAAGCMCEGRAHVDGCPVKAAQNAQRSASMKGNRNRAGTGGRDHAAS